jgi:two-component system invasion response regulator UvrY
MKYSFLLVDDHEIVFNGLKLILQTSNIDASLSYCINGDQCIKLLRKQSFDLVILDINLPDTNILGLLDLVVREFKGQKVLIFSTNSEDMYAKRFLKAGALGFVSKTATSSEIVDAMTHIIDGKTFISAHLKEQLANDFIFGPKYNLFDSLSDREIEVTKYLIQGLSNKEICNITNLHSATIGTVKSRIFTKLNVKNIIALKELTSQQGFE